MFMNKQNAFDSELVLADTQSVTADVGGKDSGGTAIILDLKGKMDEALSFNLRYTAADYTTGDEVYSVKLQSSSSATFAGSVEVDELVIPLGIAATVTGGNVLVGSYTFAPRYRYVRVYFDVTGTTPILAVDKAWICPAI